jgi:hypothetical protein
VTTASIPHRLVFLSLALFLAGILHAQSLENIQIHGYVTQGFLFSSSNNYLSMKSSDGSLKWTDGAISVSDSVTDSLRVGLQLHMYQLGEFGGPNVLVDWASADYKINERLGLRAGKVKTVLGLFNDSQDVDSAFLWILLPQGMYAIDNRGFNLSELGGEIYGTIGLGERYGKLRYSGQGGDSSLDASGGYTQQLADLGLTFQSPPSGRTYGASLNWMTPLPGLMVGSSTLTQALDGVAQQGSLHMPASFTLAQYAQWDHGRWSFAGEYWRTPTLITLTIGPDSFPIRLDQRSWYAMASYRTTEKTQIGTYYSHYVNKALDTQPDGYSKDWVVSGRYDFDPYCYTKVEGHFVHGTALGYYTSSNPGGLAPNANMIAAKIGFTF